MEIKTCSKCKLDKPKESFYKNKNSTDGYTHWCRMCCRESGNLYYKNNTIKHAVSHAEYRSKVKQKSTKDIKKRMLYSAKHRALVKGLPFNITIEDISIPDYCPILCIKLEQTNKQQRSSPSIDRIVPSEGYVKGNIQVISWQANTMKNNANKHELLLFAEWINATFGEHNE